MSKNKVSSSASIWRTTLLLMTLWHRRRYVWRPGRLSNLYEESAAGFNGRLQSSRDPWWYREGSPQRGKANHQGGSSKLETAQPALSAGPKRQIQRAGIINAAAHVTATTNADMIQMLIAARKAPIL
jgi:hypothetical protein